LFAHSPQNPELGDAAAEPRILTTKSIISYRTAARAAEKAAGALQINRMLQIISYNKWAAPKKPLKAGQKPCVRI
jgi:hypothetical protein